MKVLLTILAILALASSIWFGRSKSNQPMWAMFFAFGILMFFANIERFSEFKVGQTGFEAKTREVIEKAKSTIKELQSLAKIMASTTLGLVKRTGRLGDYPYDEQQEIKGTTLNVLREIGVSEEEIKEVVKKSEWHKFVEFDFALAILGGSKAWPAKLPEERLPEWREFRKKHGFNNIPKPAELTKLLDKCGLLSEEAKEVIKDYEHYIKFRKQRRPEIWEKRKDWSHLR